MTTDPDVIELPPPTCCAYSHPALTRATHEVDGTSVCARHLPDAIAWTRSKP